MTVTVKVLVNELDDAGRALLDWCRHQDPHLAIILAPRGEVVFVVIADSDPLGSDDVIHVILDSTIGWRERRHIYGMHGLQPHQMTGEMGLEAPIPTENHLAVVERAFGGDAREDFRRWEVPEEIVKLTREPKMPGARVINLAGAALIEFCARGKFAPSRDPDWIPQAEAARLTDVTEGSIRQAVYAGRLDSWEDSAEPNPQRRRRVRLSQVRALWPDAQARADQ